MERVSAHAGRTAVVTGGASGIGRALAERLVGEGDRVVIADIDIAAARASAETIGATALQVDVSDAESVAALARDAERSLGRIDLLASVAGVASLAPLVEMSRADWDWLLGVNFFGTVNAVTAFSPLLRASRGHILIAGSMAGFAPDTGMGGYGVTKFAVTAYAEVLAEELAQDGVGVTLLAPGPVRTSLGTSSRNRPSGSEGSLHDVDLAAGDGGGLPWIDATEVAEHAIRAVAARRRYAFTHPQWHEIVAARHRAIDEAFEQIGS